VATKPGLKISQVTQVLLNQKTLYLLLMKNLMLLHTEPLMELKFGEMRP
jgi:hypothetical protein